MMDSVRKDNQRSSSDTLVPPPLSVRLRHDVFLLIEIVYVVIGSISFTAALLLLWRAFEGAVISSPPLEAIIRSGLSALGFGGLVWISYLFLRRSRELVTEHRLISMIERLNASEIEKIDMLRELIGRARIEVRPKHQPELEESAKRALVAGRWVLDRFKEGGIVISVPRRLADAEKIRRALDVDGASIEILQLGSSSARHE